MQNEVALPTSNINKSGKTAFTGGVPVFKVSGVFSSHMVLQRGRPIRIWGFADENGIDVTGEFLGETVRDILNVSGKLPIGVSRKSQIQKMRGAI